MPDQVEIARPRIALTLSGGGFRASLFHLGVLRRLSEAGWLSVIDVLSTVSGGSVIGAYAAMRWDETVRRGATPNAFWELVAEPFVRTVSSQNFIRSWVLNLPWLALRKLHRPYSRTNLAADLYSDWFDFGSIDDLPEQPYLVLNASNLLSGRAWRFTRDGTGDSRLGYTKWPHVYPLGAAVAASAAFPPAFPPLAFATEGYTFSGPVYGEPALEMPKYLALSDGGVYDNLGVEAVAKVTRLAGRTIAPPEFLVVSDAGYPAQTRFRASGLPAIGEGFLLYRVDEVARDQVGALRRRMLIQQFRSASDPLSGVLIVLGSNVKKLPQPAYERYVSSVGSTTLIPDELLRRLQRTRTHLNIFSRVEAEALMYHGYTLTDAILEAYRDTHPAPYRTAHPGEWRIEFTAAKIAEWDRALQR